MCTCRTPTLSARTLSERKPKQVVQLTQALCLHASVSLPTHHVAASGDGFTWVQHPTAPNTVLLGARARDVALASGAQDGTDNGGCQGRNQLLVDYAHELRHEYAHEMCDALDGCPVDAASCLPSSCQPSHPLRACYLDATGVAECAEVEDSAVAHSPYLHLQLSTDACECLMQQVLVLLSPYSVLSWSCLTACSPDAVLASLDAV